MAKNSDKEQDSPKKVTDIEAAQDNIEASVAAFTERWEPWPRFDIGCEVMDIGQLRDAMGLRASIDIGDPWPKAEKLLTEQYGFRWHWLGGLRVMYMKEKPFCQIDTGWNDGEEICAVS